jgi:tetratricopeptide (TPR) repeat protein
MDMDPYRKCIHAFADQEYEGCVRMALPLLQRDVDLELLQIVLISLQRLGRVELADNLGRDGLVASEGKPWDRSLILLTLGKAAWSDVVSEAKDSQQRCQTFYYAGARESTNEHREAATRLFLGCQSTNADCLEFELARSALARLAPAGTVDLHDGHDVERVRIGHKGVSGELRIERPAGSPPVVTSRPEAQLGGWLSTPNQAGVIQTEPEGRPEPSLASSMLIDEAIPLSPVAHDAVRVFISSTFRDMHAEREVLVKSVFPALRRLCMSRGLELIEVDLRWGIPAERTTEVLPICFTEIQNCQYFVGLLGSRYGSLPETISFDSAASYPWLKGLEDRSITELEILCRFRGNPHDAARSFYYYRAPASDTPTPTAGSSADQVHSDAHQERLKELVRNSGCVVREDYLSPQEVGQMILEDLTEAIERDYPMDRPRDPVLEDRVAHEYLAAAHMRAYVPRRAFTERIDQHLNASKKPLMLVGKPGSGKSALLADWVRHHRRQAPNDIVVEHYVGANARSANCIEIMKRIMAEIRRRYRIKPETARYYELPEGENDPGSVLSFLHNHLFLAMRLPEQRLILVIDGLDQLSDPTDQELWWLPEDFSDNIALVLSARSGPAVTCAKERGWVLEELQEFSTSELSRAVVDYLHQYGKELSQDNLSALISAPQVRQPLYLRILLNELRVFGRYEDLESCISDYLEASDLAALYGKVFKRWQQDYNTTEFPGLVEQGISLLAVSRDGLTETEWMDLVCGKGAHLPRAVWAPFFLALHPHLVQRARLWCFAHEAISETVTRIFLPEEEDRRNVHGMLAEYFATSPSDDRKFRELPWHLYQRQDRDALKQCLSDPDFAVRFVIEGRTAELIAYWTSIGSTSDMVDAYRAALEQLERKDPATDRLVWLFVHLADVFTAANQLTAAESLYRGALEIRRNVPGADHASKVSIQSRLGYLLKRQGRLLEAEELLTEALHAAERELGPVHHSLSTSLIALGEVRESQAQFQQAVRCFERAFEIERYINGELHASTAECAARLARALIHDGDFDRASEFCERVLITNEQLPDKENSATRQAMDMLAEVHFRKKEYDEAETLYQRIFRRRCETLGLEHPSTAMTLSRLGLVKALQGEKVNGGKLCQQALQICLRTVGLNHPFANEIHKVASLFGNEPSPHE